MIPTRLAGAFFSGDLGFVVVGLGHGFSRKIRFAALAATPLALGGCATPLSTLDPAGPAAANIATLWWIMLWGAVGLFALVLSLLALSFIRPAAITAIKPMHWLIGGGLVLPVPILCGLVVAALMLGEQLLPKTTSGQPMRIMAEASRWNWQFSYPDIAGSVPGDVLHLPAGEPVDIVVSATDVVHSFWIPRLGGKMDAIPGHLNTIRLQADEPGTYRGICAEYCGEGHETMGFAAEAHEPDALAQAVGAAP